QLSQKCENEAAERALRQALHVARKTLGENHPQVGRILSELAYIRLRADDLDEAEDLLRQVITLERRATTRNDHAALSEFVLATVLRAKGNNAAAERTYRGLLPAARSGSGLSFG